MSRVSDVLRFKDKGLSVEDARKKMLESGDAPRGLLDPRIARPANGVVDVVEEVIVGSDTDGGLEPEFVDDGAITETKNPHAEEQDEELVIQGVKPPISANVPTPAKVTPTSEEPAQRVETDVFVGEIRQDKGEWVAELRYKNGAGTERFTSKSKNELMLELLRGKGQATLRVREAVRREKLGSPQLDKAYPLPEGMTADEFDKLPDKTQAQIIENIAVAQATIFRDQVPDYYLTQANGQALDKFLKENNLPYTVVNLKYAHENLKENGLYPDKRGVVTSPAPTTLTQPELEPAAGDSVPAAAAPVPASPVPAAPAEPKVTVRRRGSTGLQPGASSVPSGSTTPEDGKQPKELSEAELRKLPMDQLKRIAEADRRARATTR